MTTLNLRQARRLDQRLATIINQPVSITASLPAYGSVNVQEAMDDARDNFDKTFSMKLGLIELRGKIRRAIQVENENSGINSLIAERKDVERSLALVKEYLAPFTASESRHLYGHHNASSARVVETVETIQETRRLMQERGEVIQNSNLTYSVVSEQTVEQLTEIQNGLRNRLDNLNDQLTDRNSTATIAVSQADTVTLTEVGCL